MPNTPAGQSTPVDEPAGQKKPAKHGVSAVAPAGQKKPAGHGKGAPAPLPIAQKKPAAHWVHDVAPAVENGPAAHTAHVALENADVAFENVPAEQFVATAEPTGQKAPAGHETPAVAPTLAQNWPAGHGKSIAAWLPVPTQ